MAETTKKVEGPRAYTSEEVRDQLIAHVWGIVRYWGGHGGSNVPKDRDKDDCLEGVAFSILAALDGSSMAVPGFQLSPDPHPDDEEYLRSQGENWYDPETVIEDQLHEHFYRQKPEGE